MMRTTTQPSALRLRLLAALSAAVLLLGLAACSESAPVEPQAPLAVSVAPAPAPASEVDVEVSTMPAPAGMEEADEEVEDEGGSAGEVRAEAEWVDRLREVCKAVEAKPKRDARSTDGADSWKNKVSFSVKDVRLFSPDFKRWTLHSVKSENKVQRVRNRGPYYGMGVTVEMANKSDEVLLGDDVYAWATFDSPAGKRVCFASSRQTRSWNPFAGKEKTGDWVREREASEWPLRPQERKRYVLYATDCFSSMFVEFEPTNVKLELYARFQPVGKDSVIVGPMATFERPGGILRGLPVAASAQNVLKLTRKGPEPARALYMAGDRVLLAQEKGVEWVPVHDVAGVTPENQPQLDSLPAAPARFQKKYGAMTVTVDNWKVEGWRALAGALAQGHRKVSAEVSISIDTSAIEAELAAAIRTAEQAVQAAQGDLAAKESAAAKAKEAEGAAKAAEKAAKAAEKAAKKTDGYEAAKAAAATAKAAAKEAKSATKAAKKEAKSAKKAVKSAQKSLKSAQKAQSKGLASFLKSEVKNIDCGSFRLDVGRGEVRPQKGAFGSADCKALKDGAAVRGTLSFDLRRWDQPFLLQWKGAAKAMEVHPIASQALSTILKD